MARTTGKGLVIEIKKEEPKAQKSFTQAQFDSKFPLVQGPKSFGGYMYEGFSMAARYKGHLFVLTAADMNDLRKIALELCEINLNDILVHHTTSAATRYVTNELETKETGAEETTYYWYLLLKKKFVIVDFENFSGQETKYVRLGEVEEFTESAAKRCMRTAVQEKRLGLLDMKAVEKIFTTPPDDIPW